MFADDIIAQICNDKFGFINNGSVIKVIKNINICMRIKIRTRT